MSCSHFIVDHEWALYVYNESLTIASSDCSLEASLCRQALARQYICLTAIADQEPNTTAITLHKKQTTIYNINNMTSSSSHKSHIDQSGARSSRRADGTESHRDRSHRSESRSHSTRDMEHSIARNSSRRESESRSSERSDRSDKDSSRRSTKESTRESHKTEGRALARGDDYRSMVSNARTGGGHGDSTARPRRDSKAVVPREDSRTPSRSHSVRESSRGESQSRDPYDSVRTVTQGTVIPASEMRNQSVRPSESHAPSSHHSSRTHHSSSRDPSRERSRPSHSSHSSSRSRSDYRSLAHSMSQMALVPRERSIVSGSGYSQSRHSSREHGSMLPPLPESRPIGSFASGAGGSYRSGSGFDSRVGGPGGSGYGPASAYGSAMGGGSLGPYSSYGGDSRALAPYGGSSYGGGGGSATASAGPRCTTFEEFIALDMEREQQELSGAPLGPPPQPPYPFEYEDFERAIASGSGADGVREAAYERLGWYPELGSLKGLYDP